MKLIPKFIALFVLAAFTVAGTFTFTGCAGTKWADIQKTLGSPENVQTEVTVLAAVAKPHVGATAQAAVKQWAARLVAAGNLDPAELVALIPKTGDSQADALIAAGVAFINSAVAKWGTNNQTTLSYIRAVGNGLLNGFGGTASINKPVMVAANWFVEQTPVYGQEQGMRNVAKQFANATPLVTTDSQVF